VVVSSSLRRAVFPAALVLLLTGAPATASAADSPFAADPPGFATELDAPVAPGSSAPRQEEVDPDEPGVPETTDPAILAAAAARLQKADPGDFWTVTDAAVAPIVSTWDPDRGAYVTAGTRRARVNAEMLLVHAYAALAGRSAVGGESSHPVRVEVLVRLVTGPMFKARLTPEEAATPQPLQSVTIHAPGFSDPAGTVTSMHQSLDAVAMRALAVAWRARDIVGLSQEARDLIVSRVTAVARSKFWRSPSRLLNQINWNADVYAAYETVTGDPSLLRLDYRRQLIWFTDHAAKAAYPGGVPNLGSGKAFHYLPRRPADNAVNRSDTVEYANIVFGALAYLDRARTLGMGVLPKTSRKVLRQWARRITWGDWTSSGYPNWDSGRGVNRLHLTQYWLLALRGYAAGTEGSSDQGLLPDQVATTRFLARRAVATYQARAAAANSVVLPATAFGFDGGPLVTDTFDGATGTARFAATLAELADRGLATPKGADGSAKPLPAAWSNDADIGRTAVTTSRFSTAFLRPWAPLRVGGLEPARLLDSRGRALTAVGGSRDGTLGLRVLARGLEILETQRGTAQPSQSDVTPAKPKLDDARRMTAPLVLNGTDSARDLRVDVAHRISNTTLKTTYRIRNDRKGALVGELRVPTYGGEGASTLTVGQQIGPAALQKRVVVGTPSGGRFILRFADLPVGSTSSVVQPPAQRGNPLPGPELVVRIRIPPRRTISVERQIVVPNNG
jgi:hypothetical protein